MCLQIFTRHACGHLTRVDRPCPLLKSSHLHDLFCDLFNTASSRSSTLCGRTGSYCKHTKDGQFLDSSFVQVLNIRATLFDLSLRKRALLFRPLFCADRGPTHTVLLELAKLESTRRALVGWERHLVAQINAVGNASAARLTGTLSSQGKKDIRPRQPNPLSVPLPASLSLPETLPTTHLVPARLAPVARPLLPNPFVARFNPPSALRSTVNHTTTTMTALRKPFVPNFRPPPACDPSRNACGTTPPGTRTKHAIAKRLRSEGTASSAASSSDANPTSTPLREPTSVPDAAQRRSIRSRMCYDLESYQDNQSGPPVGATATATASITPANQFQANFHANPVSLQPARSWPSGSASTGLQSSSRPIDEHQTVQNHAKLSLSNLLNPVAPTVQSFTRSDELNGIRATAELFHDVRSHSARTGEPYPPDLMDFVTDEDYNRLLDLPPPPPDPEQYRLNEEYYKALNQPPPYEEVLSDETMLQVMRLSHDFQEFRETVESARVYINTPIFDNPPNPIVDESTLFMPNGRPYFDSHDMFDPNSSAYKPEFIAALNQIATRWPHMMAMDDETFNAHWEEKFGHYEWAQ